MHANMVMIHDITWLTMLLGPYNILKLCLRAVTISVVFILHPDLFLKEVINEDCNAITSY